MADTNLYKAGRPVPLFPETGRGTYTGHPKRISQPHMGLGYYTLTHALHPKAREWQRKYLEGLTGPQKINLLVVPEMHTILHGAYLVSDEIPSGGPFAQGPSGCATMCDNGLVFDIVLDTYNSADTIGVDLPTTTSSLLTAAAYTTNAYGWLNIPAVRRVNAGTSAVVAVDFTTGIPSTGDCSMADITRYLGVMLSVQGYDFQTMG